MDSGEAHNHPAVKSALASLLGKDFVVEPLYSGDFAALNTPLSLGVERKSVSNYISSLASGELDEQLTKLATVYDIPVLLIEGPMHPAPDGKVHMYPTKRSYAYSWLLSNIVAWWGRGVLPVFTKGLADLPLTIKVLYDLAAKPEHRTEFHPRQVLPSLSPVSLPERILACLPGVGEKRAKVAKGHSMEELLSWTEAEWKKTLGPTVGKRVYESLRTRG